MYCQNCQRIVDPYIEREWLLVVIDCILLRPEAYRHILYNNKDFSRYIHAQKNKETSHQQHDKGNNNVVDTGATSTSRVWSLVQWTLGSSCFHAFLKWQTLVHSKQQYEVKDGDGDAISLYVILIVTSVLDLAIQWLAVYGFIKLQSSQSKSSSITRTDTTENKDDDNNKKKFPKRRENSKVSSLSPSHSVAYQIYLGLLLPTSFQVVCVLVLLWENSKTTRALGSLLVACWQCLGLSLISINNSGKSSAKSSVLKACIPLVGIVSLIAWRFGVERLLLVLTKNTNIITFPYHKIPCVGFEMHVFGGGVNVITDEYFGGSVGWLSPPSLLCLT